MRIQSSGRGLTEWRSEWRLVSGGDASSNSKGSFTLSCSRLYPMVRSNAVMINESTKRPPKIFDCKYRDQHLPSLPHMSICCREVWEKILEILITSAQLDVSNNSHIICASVELIAKQQTVQDSHTIFAWQHHTKIKTNSAQHLSITIIRINLRFEMMIIHMPFLLRKIILVILTTNCWVWSILTAYHYGCSLIIRFTIHGIVEILL